MKCTSRLDGDYHKRCCVCNKPIWFKEYNYATDLNGKRVVFHTKCCKVSSNK